MEKFREDASSGIQHTFSEFDKHLSLLTGALSGTIQETEETIRQILGKIQQVSRTIDGLQAMAEALQTSAATFAQVMETAARRDGQAQASTSANPDPGEA